jgi:putative transcriptional regulator
MAQVYEAARGKASELIVSAREQCRKCRNHEQPFPGCVVFNGRTIRYRFDMPSQRKSRQTPKHGYLDGQMLIAMPSMGDERFARSVIYVCAHSSEGAMGIIVNHAAAHIDFRDLLVQLKVVPDDDMIHLPTDASGVQVMKGGPVETERGFVLHSADYFIENSTLPIDEGVCLTATLDILKAIARGSGPRSAILALGYAGWAPGQLEQEIHQNGWLHCAPDLDLIFGNNLESKYTRALQKIGIEVGMLSTEAGHA